MRQMLQLTVLALRDDRANEVEILVLRRQVAVLRRQVRRLDLQTGRPAGTGRVVSAGAAATVGGVLPHPGHLVAVAPELITRQWTYPSRTPGRPSV
jgi:putative transposase